MNYELYPRIIFKILLYLILFLLCANVFGIVSKLYFDHNSIHGLIPLFDFRTEGNIPTLYSSFALIVASILFSIIAFAHKRIHTSYLSWAGLAIIFLFLSIDEMASIHERFSAPVRESLNVSGLLYYSWVIPYGVALIVFVIVYLKFLADLPKNIMILFVVSGAIFVLGAVGFELLGGRQYELHGDNNLLYAFFYTCEEFLEMFGIVILIYTLLSYIVSQFKYLTITITKNK